MPKHASGRASAPSTPFEDLNAVLAELTRRLQAHLGDNLVGVYLQGSFAIGDADDRSDVDLTFVLARDLTAEEIPPLEALHAEIHAMPTVWAQHLEGSYMPREILRRWSLTPRDPPGEARSADWGDPGLNGAPPRVYPFWYLNNGSTRLVRSEHDNTQVVRWALREKGVVLAGPEPRRLIDPVTPDLLRGEVRALLQTLVARIQTEPSLTEVRWIQAFMAVLFARMLQTIATGRLASKAAAVAYARQALDPRWADLVERSWRFRRDHPRGHGAPEAFAAQPSDPADVAETIAFAKAALEIAAHDPVSAARAALERKLAHQAQRRPGPGGADRSGFNAAGGARQGWTPPPIRPGGRGRRG